MNTCEKIAVSVKQLGTINRLAKRTKVAIGNSPVFGGEATTTLSGKAARANMARSKMLLQRMEKHRVRGSGPDIGPQKEAFRSGDAIMKASLANKLPYSHIVKRKMNPIREHSLVRSVTKGKLKGDPKANHLFNSSVNAHEMAEGKAAKKAVRGKVFGRTHAHPDVIAGESNLFAASPYSKKSTDKTRGVIAKVRDMDGSTEAIKRSVPGFEYGKTKLSPAMKRKVARDNGFGKGTFAERKATRVSDAQLGINYDQRKEANKLVDNMYSRKSRIDRIKARKEP